MIDLAPPNITERIEALHEAERDYDRGLSHASGERRLELTAKLTRIRRQIAMLMEAERKPMEMPELGRRFS